MTEQIEITISPEGKITLHVQGVTGLACDDLTAALEMLLEGETNKEYTPEAFGGGAVANQQGQAQW